MNPPEIRIRQDGFLDITFVVFAPCGRRMAMNNIRKEQAPGQYEVGVEFGKPFFGSGCDGCRVGVLVKHLNKIYKNHEVRPEVLSHQISGRCKANN